MQVCKTNWSVTGEKKELITSFEQVGKLVKGRTISSWVVRRRSKIPDSLESKYNKWTTKFCVVKFFKSYVLPLKTTRHEQIGIKRMEAQSVGAALKASDFVRDFIGTNAKVQNHDFPVSYREMNNYNKKL